MNTEICKDLNALHPKVKELALKLLDECKKAGLNIKISETYRTKERQDYLYAQGRTRAGDIVTQSKGSAMSSYHQWRLAFDIYNDVPGDSYNIDVLNKAGKIGETLGLEWGGSWQGFKDRPHFQYTFGLSISDLRSGKKPPSYASPSQPLASQNDTDYENAVNLLAAKGIISSSAFWLNLSAKTNQYVPTLATNIAKYFDSSVTSYEAAIKKLIDKKIISSPEAWHSTTDFSEVQIKSLIKKSAALL